MSSFRAATAAFALAGLAVAVLVGCGSDDSFSGTVKDPPASVVDLSLPDRATNSDFAFKAADDDLLVVYFGYTGCPDVCPTTLADLASALDAMDDKDADRVDVAMATIDPEKDLDLITDYVQSFIPSAVGLGTDDPDALRAVADGFGVSYGVVTKDGERDVTHSGTLYAVDDTGHIALEWLYGTPPEDLTRDLTTLLHRDN